MDLIRIEIHAGFPNLLIEQYNLKIDQLKHDVDTMIGICIREPISMGKKSSLVPIIPTSAAIGLYNGGPYKLIVFCF